MAPTWAGPGLLKAAETFIKFTAILMQIKFGHIKVSK